MGICFEEEHCHHHKKCDTCNECYILDRCCIKFIGPDKNITFNEDTFCEFLACEEGHPCTTSHYFFLGKVCKCGCGKLIYDEADVYYLKNINGTYFLYCHKDNKKITKEYWCSEGNPGTWSSIYMICADPIGRGPL